MKVVRFNRESGFIRDLESLDAADPVQMSIADLDDSE
jgi:hypothetical protein